LRHKGYFIRVIAFGRKIDNRLATAKPKIIMPIFFRAMAPISDPGQSTFDSGLPNRQKSQIHQQSLQASVLALLVDMIRPTFNNVHCNMIHRNIINYGTDFKTGHH
jgi:hypothetical protein